MATATITLAPARCSRKCAARYAKTDFANVIYKGNAVYIRLPSPAGRRVRRRTSCATPRHARALLDRVEALVCDGVEPLWWPIVAVLERRISVERLAHALDPRSGGLTELASQLTTAHADADAASCGAICVAPLIDEYDALDTHNARRAGALLSEKTVRMYVQHMRAAARDMRTVSEWTPERIKRHLDSITVIQRSGDGASAAVPVNPFTHRRHLWALLTFGDFLVARGCVAANPAERVAPRALSGTHRKKQVWLQHAEWLQILSRIDAGGVRDALAFMLATGAEPGATCALTGDKVRDAGALVVIDTNRKSGAARQRTVAVDGEFRVRLALRAESARAGLVFPGCSVARLGATLDRVRTTLAAEGFAKHALIHPYQLRHSWACETLEAGALIHDVSAQLGHAKVSTTLDTYGPGRANAARVAHARDTVAMAARNQLRGVALA